MYASLEKPRQIYHPSDKNLDATNLSGILVMPLSTWARFSTILTIYHGPQAACYLML